MIAKEREASLLEAAHRGDLAQVQLLLAQGTDVDAADGHGMVSLHFAASAGHLEVVRALLAGLIFSSQLSSVQRIIFLIMCLFVSDFFVSRTIPPRCTGPARTATWRSSGSC